MTHEDDTTRGEDPPGQRQAGDDRYVSYEADDGSYVIRDESAADAWIRSDTVVALAPDDA